MFFSSVDWSIFKTIVGSNAIGYIQYTGSTNTYLVGFYLIQADVFVQSPVSAPSDVTDFETNYKPTATSFADLDDMVAVLAANITATQGVTVSSMFAVPTTAKLSSTPINLTSSGDNTVKAGVGGQTIRVFRIFFTTTVAQTITFKDGASTALTGPVNFTAAGAMVLDFDAEPYFITSSGNGFVMNLSVGGQVSGRIYYTQS